jgi:hypothetical protein
VDTSTLRCGALGGIEHAQGLSTTILYNRVRDGALGAFGEDVSIQREGLVVGGAADWAALPLALSLIKTKFTGRDSMKLDREEEVMIAILQRPVEIIYERFERQTRHSRVFLTGFGRGVFCLCLLYISEHPKRRSQRV